MSRAKGGFKSRRRRKRLLKLAKGYRMTRNHNISVATHVVRRALVFAYRDRRVKRREFRRLWTVRINAAARALGLKYSEFISGLKKAGIEIDRSVLANMAITDSAGFGKLVEQAKAARGL